MNQPDDIISYNLKRLREERNLSYTQLSELTDVSKSMLRQIEIGESSPTVNTLSKIAKGLEVPFTVFLNPPTYKFSKLKLKERQPILGMTEGYRLYPLITFETKRSFELYYVELDPGIAHDAPPHTGNAEEIVMVIEGVIEVSVQGSVSKVRSDEILQFDASHPHHYQNPTDSIAQAFMIISYSH